METIIEQPIEQDMKRSYLDYSMSVIVGRALPDVRDGLKPVHRRILYSMYELNNFHNKPYKKSARIVGEVLGKYHPHGDNAIYDSLVRMAQEFSLRYPLVDGQGNFGSIDGDNPAAMRYTESRMKLISEEMLKDIEKETVDFNPNFDTTLKEPVVLPSKIPNLIINGSSGIAVGMATNIAPHNISEIIDATIALIDGAEKNDVISKVKGPDFPTGGIIVGRSGIHLANTTGRGKIKIRSRCEIDQEKNSIIVTEIPYQVKKTTIIGKIVDVVKIGKIKGIRGVHDHSDKDGIRVVIELKRGENAEVVLNQLYKYTPLQTVFGIINLVLVERQPKLLDLHSILNEFVEFRKEIVTKRCQFDLKKAQARAHILEGLKRAIEDIDSVVDLLRKAQDAKSAKDQLMEKYQLSDVQSKAILDMKLSKLISLEQQKLLTELEELIKEIKNLEEILGDVSKILAIIKEELEEVRSRYGDTRKTEIIDDEDEIDLEELIPNDEVVVMMTSRGYVKRAKLDVYKAQKRGGRGVIGAETKEADVVEDVIITMNHNYLLFFTNKGRVHWLKTYRIPEMGRYAVGKAIVNLMNLDQNEKITSWIPVKEFSENEYLSMITKRGIIKRTSIVSYSRPRKGGIIAINLRENDELVSVLKTPGDKDIIIATKDGQAIRFKETDAREIGRTGMGVIGIRMKNTDEVVSAAICNKPAILTITENGFGKRTSIDEYRTQGRGGSGVINIKTEGRNGKVVKAKAVTSDDQVIVLSDKGQTIRMPVQNISVVGRNTLGVRIIRLKEKEKVASFAVIKAEFLD